jgi:serine/threonine protein kinase
MNEFLPFEAPELILSSSTSSSIDIYAYSIISYQLITRSPS